MPATVQAVAFALPIRRVERRQNVLLLWLEDPAVFIDETVLADCVSSAWGLLVLRQLHGIDGPHGGVADRHTQIAQQLQARLSPNEKAEMAKAPTTDPIAYDLYLRARQLDDMSNAPDAKGSLLQGISLLEEAVRRDSKFLRAYCLMCETHLDLYWRELLAPTACFRAAAKAG